MSKQLDVTGRTLGTLLIGERIPSDQPRYHYTCLHCKHKGERNYRYLSNGCPKCHCPPNAQATVTTMLAVTSTRALEMPAAQLHKALQDNPDTAFYLAGRRVSVKMQASAAVVSYLDLDGLIVNSVHEQDTAPKLYVVKENGNG